MNTILSSFTQLLTIEHSDYNSILLRELEIHKMQKHVREHTNMCYNHPTDSNKVVIYTASNKTDLYVWQYHNKCRFMPIVFEYILSTDEDGDRCGVFVVEKLKSGTIESVDNRLWDHNISNSSHKLKRLIIDIIKNKKTVYDVSSFAEFCKNILNYCNQRKNHDEYSKLYQAITISYFIKNSSYFKELFYFIKTISQYSSLTINNSELLARKNEIVFINPISLYSNNDSLRNASPTMNIDNKFEVQSLYSSFNQTPITPVYINNANVNYQVTHLNINKNKSIFSPLTKV